MPGSEQDPENISPWFIFNDFAVKNVSEEEALNFPDLWKASHQVFSKANRVYVYCAGTCCSVLGEGGREGQDRFQCTAGRDRYFSAQPR